MHTEQIFDDEGHAREVDYHHHDGTRHALLCAVIQEAEARTYSDAHSRRDEITPEQRAAARATWQTFSYLCHVIDNLEYADLYADARAAACYEEAIEAEEHAYNYNTARTSQRSAEEEHNAMEAREHARTAAALRVLESVTPRPYEREAARAYRYTLTDAPPYVLPMYEE